MLGFRRGVLIGAVAAATVTLVAADASADRIRCGSRDYRYEFCAVPGGRVINARVVRRHSKRPCVQNFSWGIERDGVWVDDGCDADFDVAVRGGGNGGYGGGSYPGAGRPDRPYGRPPQSASPAQWAIGEWRGQGYRFTVYRGGSVILSRGNQYERGYMDGDNITLYDGTRLDADRDRNQLRLGWPNGREVRLRRERDFDY
jgi:hypothetical protein